jgi:hypothetical protein
MMSPGVLRAINDEIAAEAARVNRVPYVPFDATEPKRWPPFPFPNLGSYVPPGWALAEENWFIDKTGRGRPSELALTAEEFRTLLIDYVSEHPEHGYAVIEEGPFQAVIGAMYRVREQADEVLRNGSRAQ